MSQKNSMLEEEIESWKGFPWALRKEDRELWSVMVHEVREQFGETVELSGKNITTDPFFMALLLAQHKVIKRLKDELRAQGVELPDSEVDMITTLDMHTNEDLS